MDGRVVWCVPAHTWQKGVCIYIYKLISYIDLCRYNTARGDCINPGIPSKELGFCLYAPSGRNQLCEMEEPGSV